MRVPFAAAAAALALAACSGISTTSDWDESFDFSGLSTYAWMDQGLEGGVSEIMLRRMYMAADETLEGRGFTRTDEEQADFIMAYHAGAQDRQQYDTYGYGAGGWWGGYWGGGMTTTTVRTYTEGTLILDVIDRDSNELVWRGSASRTIDQMEAPEQRVESIRKAVEEMLRDFPPG
jgi:hypothetical protein